MIKKHWLVLFLCLTIVAGCGIEQNCIEEESKIEINDNNYEKEIINHSYTTNDDSLFDMPYSTLNDYFAIYLY